MVSMRHTPSVVNVMSKEEKNEEEADENKQPSWLQLQQEKQIATVDTLMHFCQPSATLVSKLLHFYSHFSTIQLLTPARLLCR